MRGREHTDSFVWQKQPCLAETMAAPSGGDEAKSPLDESVVVAVDLDEVVSGRFGVLYRV